MREICLVLFTGFIALIILETISQKSSSHSKLHKQILHPEQLDFESDLHETNIPFISEATVAEVEVVGTGAMTLKFEKRLWPRLRQVLCPNMVPNVKLAKERIFHLARERMGFSRRYEEHLATQQDEDDVFQRFFQFHVTINTYITQKPKKSKSSQNNETYVMGYLPVWKSGNDLLRYALRDTLGDAFDLKGIDRLDDFFSNKLPKLTNHESCLIAVIRDPVSHFLSGYNEIDNRFTSQRHSYFHDYPFSRFADGSKDRFEQFVIDILSAPLTKRTKGRFDVRPLAMPHIYLASGILVALAQNNATLTDYLTNLKDLSESAPSFMATACPDITFPENFETTALNFSAVGRPGGRRSLAGTVKSLREEKARLRYDAAKSVWEEGGLIAEVLCILHVMDYACFDKLVIPPLCQEVYSEDDFVSALSSKDFSF